MVLAHFTNTQGLINMTTSSLKSGYLVATDEHPVCIYDTLKEAEEHINFQRTIMGSKATWYIVEIKLSNWKTYKYEQEIQSL